VYTFLRHIPVVEGNLNFVLWHSRIALSKATNALVEIPEHLPLSQPAKMDIDTDEEVLQTLANGQTID
jgi:hypothetical protein